MSPLRSYCSSLFYSQTFFACTDYFILKNYLFVSLSLCTSEEEAKESYCHILLLTSMVSTDKTYRWRRKS